jgi:alpha-galactosidase/6-phospho-beta-glucosidase family protein
MFQTVEKLISKKKKVCIIGCGVQYFEKLLKSSRTSESEVKDPGKILMDFHPAELDKLRSE